MKYFALGLLVFTSFSVQAAPPAEILQLENQELSHACAIWRDEAGKSKLDCWGWCEQGQCEVPADLEEPMQIALAGGLTCSLSVDGKIRCWGLDNWTNWPRPEFKERYKMLAAGALGICAVQSDGLTVECQATSKVYDSSDLVWMGLVPPLFEKPIMKLSAHPEGSYAFCALDAAKMMACWGSQVDSLSEDPPNNHGKPVYIQNVRDMGVGYANIYYIDDTAGEMISFPVFGTNVTPSGLDFLTIADAERQMMCATKLDGTKQCWGGIGSYEQLREPFANYKMIAHDGRESTCAVSSEAKIECVSHWPAEFENKKLDVPLHLKR